MKRFILTYIIHARALLCVTFNMGFPQKSATAWFASRDTRIEIDTHTIIRTYIPHNQHKPTRTLYMRKQGRRCVLHIMFNLIHDSLFYSWCSSIR